MTSASMRSCAARAFSLLHRPTTRGAGSAPAAAASQSASSPSTANASRTRSASRRNAPSLARAAACDRPLPQRRSVPRRAAATRPADLALDLQRRACAAPRPITPCGATARSAASTTDDSDCAHSPAPSRAPAGSRSADRRDRDTRAISAGRMPCGTGCRPRRHWRPVRWKTTCDLSWLVHGRYGQTVNLSNSASSDVRMVSAVRSMPGARAGPRSRGPPGCGRGCRPGSGRRWTRFRARGRCPTDRARAGCGRSSAAPG